MKAWKWQIYSVVLSLIAMAFAYAILNLPLKDGIIAAFGLLILIVALLANPINRYLHLAMFVLFTWVGMAAGLEFKLDIFYESLGQLYIRKGDAPLYIHILMAIISMTLIALDYLTREKTIMCHKHRQ